MAQAWAALREGSGHGRTDAFAASELPGSHAYDVVVALQRTGTTTEVAHALARTNGARTVAITAVAGTPVADAADEVVVLDFADEQSVVQTRFATTALTLLRAHQGVDVEPSASDAERALELPLPVRAGRRRPVGLPGSRLDGRPRVRGRAQAARGGAGVDRGLPRLRVPARADQHRRTGRGGLVPRRAGRRRARQRPDGRRDRRGARLDLLASLVLAQRTAVALAEAAGLDPDNPRNLTRSVVLTSTEVQQ